jgi:iron complex outermembrane recepter protein
MMARRFCFLFGLLFAVGVYAAESVDLHALSLEDLMDIEVTLTSRSQQRLFDTPSAVYVLTKEDLRRSGATGLPEALRLVPGVEVARLDASKWGVAARGFNGRFANKILVLIDGRAIYTPFYSGVMWEVRDVLLEDVERIEVIRGPGGTLWGANAVNGIINIVTSPAQDTAGGFLRVGGGVEESGLLDARYGWAAAENTDVRLFARTFAHDAFIDSVGGEGVDDWHMARTGFRLDHHLTRGELSLHGDIYQGQRGQFYRFATLSPPYIEPVQDDTELTGGYLQGSWTHTLDAGSQLRLQLYYDRTSWADTLIGEARDTWDADFQHRFDWGQQQVLVWGVGLRLSADEIESTPNFALDPSSRTSPLYSAFVQDQIDVGTNWRVFVGSKLEHNDYTGIEVQPSARLLWTPSDRHAAWAAVSRAVRTPSRAEDDARLLNRTLPPDDILPDTPAALVYNVGDRSVESEKLVALELGYRMQPRDGLALDMATYYNRYRKLRIGRLRVPVYMEEPVPHLVIELPSDNLMRGTTYGAELSIDWRNPAAAWRLRGSYSWLQMDLATRGDANPVATFEEGASPEHQLLLWPSLDLPHALRLDATLRFVDRLPFYDIDAYTELDVRLAWEPTKALEVAIVGQSLLAADHEEFGDIFVNTVTTRVQRGVHATAAWRF